MRLNWFRASCIALGVLCLTSGAVSADNVVAPSQARMLPQSAAQVQLSFAPVVTKTAPAVVNVYSRRVVQTRSPFMDDDFWAQFGGPNFFGVPRQRIEQSLGSGVIVRSDGIIVTNNHVIAGGDELTVALADRREFAAKVALADEQTDIAILKIDTKGQPLPIIGFADSDRAQVGDLVLAIGNPFGVGQTVTSGIVSALARTQVGISDYQFFIQTDAPINPGNSGGALVGLDGNLLGINTAIYSRGGGSNGVGFAIPANMVKLVVDQALSAGRVVRPWLGADGQEVDSKLAASLGLDRPHGVLVTSVQPNSPASKAGIAVGDLINSINGFAVNDMTGVRYRITTQKAGATVPIEFARKGQVVHANLTLTTPPEIPPRQETVLQGQQPLAGAKVINLSPAVNDQYGLEYKVRGVMVIETMPRSIAQQYGFAKGDIIGSVNGVPVKTVDDLTKALAPAVHTWRVQINRGGQLINATFQA
ncbi:MAG: DegQ family serine endoprotease [Alphaproteobacteria bacterium]